MLVGKHGYTCGFSLVSLFTSGTQGMTDILVTVHYSVNNHYVVRSVLEEASLKAGNKSVLRT